MGRPKFIVTDRGWSKLLAAAKELRASPILKVGMLEKTAARSGDLTNAELAIILHFGTRDIPGRPFLYRALSENKRKWNRRLAKIGRAVLAGKMTAEEGLASLGPTICAEIRRAMQHVGVPDAPATLEEKHGSTPLVDSRQLLDSVSFEVAGAH